MSEHRQTKNCPYCGEEILAGARKCKHCGEWLEKPDETESVLTEEEIDKIAEDAVNEVFAEMEEKDEKKRKIWKIVDNALIIIGVLLLLFFTVPDEAKHMAKVRSVANESYELLIHNLTLIAAENKPALLSVSDIITPELCYNLKSKLFETFEAEFEYTNCLLFSVGDIGGETSQIGVLGFVLDFTSIPEEEMEDSAIEIWNAIVDAWNDSAVSLLDLL